MYGTKQSWYHPNSLKVQPLAPVTEAAVTVFREAQG